jgi:peptidoglycan/xylan/chitin deacetylase (PgdA/CDA1 family)
MYLYLKLITTFFIYRMKLLNFLLLRKKKSSIGPILMYHRFFDKYLPDFIVQPGMYTLTKTFRNHILTLKKNFTILSLPCFIDKILQAHDTNNYCAITFDDGWIDNFSKCYHILKEFHVPATIFLATDYVGTKQHFWPEELSYFLSQENTLFHTDPITQNFLKSVPSHNNFQVFLENAITVLKSWSPIDRNNLLLHFRINYLEHPQERMMINWEEAKEMQESGLITFGAHSASHVILDQVSLNEAEMEIISSRDAIQEKLGIRPEIFAYPNGNYNAEIKALVKKNGFKAAVTTRKDWVETNSDIFQLPRIGIHEDVSKTIPMFLARICMQRF